MTLPTFKCRCTRAVANWHCQRVGHPACWLCNACHAQWAAKLDADMGARV